MQTTTRFGFRHSFDTIELACPILYLTLLQYVVVQCARADACSAMYPVHGLRWESGWKGYTLW